MTEYDKAYAQAQAGGMNETDCHEFATEQADRAARLKRVRRSQSRDGVLRDLGLVKVRGASGGTYWE